MAAVVNPLRRLRMMVRAHGYGVHSPFAYRFITQVLRQPYAYYAYDELSSDSQRQLYRIALDLGGTRVAVYAAAGAARAVRLALPKARFTDSRPDLVVAHWPSVTADDAKAIIEAVAAGASAVIYRADDDTRSRLLAAMEHGMTFTNAHGTVVIAVRRLPRQDFEVEF